MLLFLLVTFGHMRNCQSKQDGNVIDFRFCKVGSNAFCKGRKLMSEVMSSPVCLKRDGMSGVVFFAGMFLIPENGDVVILED